LLGKAYYFYDLKGWKITSPLNGIISKIYPNYALQITNEYGLQIILDIQVNERNLEPLDKILQCEVKEKQIVSPQTTLFIIYLVKQVNCIAVYVP
jgi:phosphotransferase system IIA component